MQTQSTITLGILCAVIGVALFAGVVAPDWSESAPRSRQPWDVPSDSLVPELPAADLEVTRRESDFRQALADAADSSYDVVLVDQLMPDSDGFDFVQRMREDRVGRPIMPVLLLAPSEGRDVEREEHLRIGACLAKPIGQSLFFETLASTMLGVKTGASKSEPEEALASESLQGQVLVVEDNPVNQTVARKLLERLGLEVTVTANGLEAIEAVTQANYATIFMDCQMPLMDGFEATAVIRSMEDNGERLPIVAMTTNALQGDRERCLRAGMDDYLAKPVKKSELRNAARRWIGQRTCR
jgi:two-component system, sensor histidine kinase and response regulator